jgi:hypothetical protein
MAPRAPPPTAMASPVMAALRGEARKATTSATSAAVTMRPMLVPADSWADPASAGQRRDHRGRALGGGHAGVDDGDVDPGRPEFVGEVLGHGGHRHVTDRTEHAAGLTRRQAADIDDPPPALRGHMRRRGAGAAQVAEHLGLDLGPQVVIGELGQGPWRCRPAGLGRGIDEDVDPAELGHRAGDHGANGAVIGGVRRDRQHPRTGPRQPACGGIERGLVPGHQNQLCALGR